MYSSDIQAVIQGMISGDAAAFDRFVVACRPPLLRYLINHVKCQDDAENITQETLLSACRAICELRYNHRGDAALRAWLRKIAWRKIVSTVTTTGSWNISLHQLSTDGEEFDIEPSTPSDAVEDETTQNLLIEFIDRQLDEALILCSSNESDRLKGQLKKLAFMYFHVDELSQVETARIVSRHAAGLGMAAAVTQTTINNWISRGDVLHTLIRHLVTHHAKMLDKITLATVDRCGLTLVEANAIRHHWWVDDAIESIKDDSVNVQYDSAFESAKRKIAEKLFMDIKGQLHVLRHR